MNRAHKQLAIGRGLSAIDATGADPAFLWHALRRAVPHLVRVSQGSTFAAVSKADLYALKVSLPPPNEQRKIAAILSSVDDAIEKTQAIVDQSQVVKRGVMRALFYLPQRSEQHRIAAILSSMDDAIEKSAQSVARLQSVKSGLMGCLLTGQVRVTADTVASAAKEGGWGRGAAHPPRLANR